MILYRHWRDLVKEFWRWTGIVSSFQSPTGSTVHRPRRTHIGVVSRSMNSRSTRPQTHGSSLNHRLHGIRTFSRLQKVSA